MLNIFKKKIKVVSNQYLGWFQNGGRSKLGFRLFKTRNFERVVKYALIYFETLLTG